MIRFREDGCRNLNSALRGEWLEARNWWVCLGQLPVSPRTAQLIEGLVAGGGFEPPTFGL